MGDGRWEMGDGRWEMGDGRWEMGDGRWEMGRCENSIVHCLMSEDRLMLLQPYSLASGKED